MLPRFLILASAGFCYFVIASSADAFTLFDAGGFGGYTYNKWGSPTTGTGAEVTWSLLPPGTPGSSYCGDACLGTSTDMLNVWDDGANAFVMTSITDIVPVLQQAMDAWSRVADITFVGPLADSGVPINDVSALPPLTGEVRIGAFDFTGSLLFAGAVGYAPPPNGGTGEGDILFNSSNYFQFAPGNEGENFDLYPPGGDPS